MSMEIHMAKVGIGDCILIRMGKSDKKINILVDSGKNDDGYKDTIKYIRDNHEAIDYMMLTHDDDDHIMGIYNLFMSTAIEDAVEAQIKSLFLDKKVIMNYCMKDKESLLSYKKVKEIGTKLEEQDIDLKKLDFCVANPIKNDKTEGLNLIQILWKIDSDGKIDSQIRNTIVGKDDGEFPEVPKEYEHADILIMSPYSENVKKYIEYICRNEQIKETELSSKKKDKDNIDEWEYSIQELFDCPLHIDEDCSIVNNSSISFLLFYDGIKCLFAGDAKPSDVVNTAKRYLNFIGSSEKVIPIEFLKLPHHASSHNNSEEFLKMFPTNHYLISTKGSNKYKHPGKQTLANIARVHKEDDNIKLLCNYSPWKSGNIRFKDNEHAWDTEKDICKINLKNKKKITLHFIEMNKDGYEIQIPSSNLAKILIRT